MKKIFLILFSFFSLLANAQSAEEIIQKYSDAMGGLDAFKKVQTVKITGVVTAQGMDLPLTIQIINGRAMRTDAEVMGQFITNVYKDGSGWKINPFAGAETATDVEGKELLDFKAQANLVSILMDYKNLGHHVEYIGPEEVEGVKTHKLKLTPKDDGNSTFYYISTDNNYIVKTVTNREFQGQTVEAETFFSEVKEFGGLKFTMVRTQKMGGQTIQVITFNDIALNVPVDDKIFDK